MGRTRGIAEFALNDFTMRITKDLCAASIGMACYVAGLAYRPAHILGIAGSIIVITIGLVTLVRFAAARKAPNPSSQRDT